MSTGLRIIDRMTANENIQNEDPDPEPLASGHIRDAVRIALRHAKGGE